MIVMKFGGSSLADADRIRAVAAIVAARRSHRPLVVVSALGGTTDLLAEAVAHAAAGRRDAIEPLLAELERRHRWAVAGTVSDSGRRHDLSLELDRGFDELKQRLRSIRVLGEATPRAVDAILACGELWSSSIVAAAFADSDLPAERIDPRSLVATDENHGCARPDPSRVARACRELVLPVREAGRVAVTGGFVGSGPGGDTTTLGRGGSDTTASVLGLALEADEIQIWTDVDGLMSADPRRVPAARTLSRLSFAEAAELALCGARVLHPAAIAPAVAREIPVRVLNSMRPDGDGTLIVADARGSDGDGAPAALVSRGGIELVRLSTRRFELGERPAPLVDAALTRLGLAPLVFVANETSVCVALAEDGAGGQLAAAVGDALQTTVSTDRGLLSIVGAGLASDDALRRRVLDELVGCEPDLLAVGASDVSLSAVLPAATLDRTLCELHHRFFEHTPCR